MRNSSLPPLIKKQVVMIRDGNELAGTGVVIGSSGLVLTCSHVIPDIQNVANLRVTIDSQQYQPTLFSHDKILDIAILKLPEKLPFSGFQPKRSLVRWNQKVICYGYQGSIDTRNRLVSIDGHVLKSNIFNGKTSSIEICANLHKGFSGGPVVDFSTRKLLGIITSSKNDNKNYCIPLKTILTLLSPSDLNPQEFNWVKYANKIVGNYKAVKAFNNYIDLRCRTSGAKPCKAERYILDDWLSAKGKCLLTVLGDFGSGKTLLCHKIANTLATQYLSGKQVMMPIVLKLGEANQFENIQDYIHNRISGALDSDITWHQIELLLNSGKILLIFDGFDEMAMKASSFQITINFNIIRDVIKPGTKAILTCRTHYFGPKESEIQRLARNRTSDFFENLVLEEGTSDQTTIVYIEGLNDENVKQYLKNEVKDWKGLFDLIKNPEFYNLYDLSKRPIFLNIIAETIPGVKSTEETINGTRLYQMYTEKVFIREGRKLPGNVAANEFQQAKAQAEAGAKIVEEIAFEMYKDNRSSLSPDFITEMSSKLKYTPQQLDQYLRKSPFFKASSQDEGHLVYIHQSFFEFFVADKIARDIQIRIHESYRAEYLTPQIDKYFFDLLEFGNNTKVIVAWLERYRKDVNLRMNCALTLGRSGDKKFIPILKACLKTELDIGVGGRISEALGALGCEIAIEEFLRDLEGYDGVTAETGKNDDHRLLYDIVDPLAISNRLIIKKLIKNTKHENPRISKYAVFSLGRIGSQESIPSLVSVLNNPRKTNRTRRYAAAALGLIGGKKALAGLQTAISSNIPEIIRDECINSVERIQHRK